MDSLHLVDAWPVPHVAVAAVTPAGVVAARGDTARPFRIASLAKLLTAYATLVAIEEGTVALDDAAGPPGATLAHLLAHASGYGFESDAPPLARPGTRRIYSNRGIEEAAAHVARASSLPFATYLGEAVLTPLAMTSTELRGSAAHGVWSTVDDLVRFAAELFAPRVLAPETLDEMRAVHFPGLPGVLPGVRRYDPLDWGLGFERNFAKPGHWAGTRVAADTYGHFGGSGTFLWLDPVARLACVCLADREFDDWALAAWPPFCDALVADASAAVEASGDTDALGRRACRACRPGAPYSLSVTPPERIPADLQHVFELEPHGPDTWVGESPHYSWGRIFGGLVVAQALLAAVRTVNPAHAVHSLHGYFILGGDPSEPVRYEVDRLRNGRSFTTRQVVARQSGGAIFNLSCSFQRHEPGVETQTAGRPTDAPPPPETPGVREGSGIDRHEVPQPPGVPRSLVWARYPLPLGEEPNLHACALAYLSDTNAMDAIAASHPRGNPADDWDETYMSASLDHALWFHRPARADDWLLFDLDGHGIVRTRGLSTGRVFTAGGLHVATIAQEGLIRLVPPTT